MKRLLDRYVHHADPLLARAIVPAALLLRSVRRVGFRRLPQCREALIRAGVFPIVDHYYEPAFDNRTPETPFDRERPLPGIRFDADAQLAWLRGLGRADELLESDASLPDALQFDFDNPSFKSGDAEVWYQVVRTVRPKRLVEIGSGNSTRLAARAIRRSMADDPDYRCEHVCIEPYEMPWLEEAGVTTVRERVERVDPSIFAALEDGDILFIDSSHIIRPQGDVLFEYLDLLPTLAPGVIVHVHDIFTPRDYPASWLQQDVLFWNEQYLLEAFLSENERWEILGGVNFLRHRHFDALDAVCVKLTETSEPGSIYLRRR